MLNLHVIQAEQGDCFLLQFGDSEYALIDGGPKGNWKHLSPALRSLPRLELAILSHIDNDHILGFLEFFADLQRRKAAGQPRIEIGALWHNAFSETVGHQINQRLKSLIDEEAGRGFREGSELAGIATELEISVNPQFHGGLVTREAEPFRCGQLKLRVVAPDQAALKRLRKSWEKWLEKAEKEAGRGRKVSLETSPSNRSSIVVLAECGGRSILFTGDARHDEIEDGLERAGVSQEGRLHVNLLKVQHHGSNRNSRREFFDRITADKYVISANGRDGNPDLEALQWLVDAAHAQRRRIEVFVTNASEAVLKLSETRPPAKYGYELQVMPKRESVHLIEV